MVAGVSWLAAVSSATALTYLRNAWNNGSCAAPVQATVSVPVGSSGDQRRGLNESSGLSKRDAQVNGYGFEVTNGYDNYDCEYTLSDQDWGNAVQAITEYMVKYEEECVQVIARGDNGYEGNTITWILTDDGANHKTCG